MAGSKLVITSEYFFKFHVIVRCFYACFLTDIPNLKTVVEFQVLQWADITQAEAYQKIVDNIIDIFYPINA